MEHDHHKNRLHAAMVISATAMLLAVLIVSLFEGYVRWFLNQNYTVFGGLQLEALTVSGTALLIALGLKK